ncbi:MAG: response regulator transcription factor [Thermoanaerobaculia bacterium]
MTSIPGAAVDPLRVLIVSDDPLVREGLSALVAREASLIEAGQCTSEAAHRAAQSARANVLLWDVGESGGGSMSEEIRLPPVLALVSGAPQASEMLALGARGCVSRDTESGRLAAALRAVVSGLRVLDESLAGTLLHLSPFDADAAVEPLTPREQEVLGLLSLGLTNKAIAGRLAISEHTAKFHVNALIAKLGVEDPHGSRRQGGPARPRRPLRIPAPRLIG